MRTIAFVLAACTAHAGYGRRVQSPTGQVEDSFSQSRARAGVDTLRALALSLLAFNPTVLNKVDLHIPALRLPRHSSTLMQPKDPQTSRRALVSGAAALSMLPLVANAVGGAPEGMKTSMDYTNLQQIAPEVTGTLGAGTMSSRSRPVTGVVLLESPQETGTPPYVSAELVLDGGVIANVGFQAEQGYPLNRGMFFDVEVRGKNTDSSAFLQVAKLPDGKSISDVKDSFLTKAVFSTGGRFGAYGAPTDIKVVESQEKPGPLRMLDVTFSTPSPGQLEVPRRAIISAIQPKGSDNVVMLIGGSSPKKWQKEFPSLFRMASSLKVDKTRATNLKRETKNDFRFEEQGGLKEGVGIKGPTDSTLLGAELY